MALIYSGSILAQDYSKASPINRSAKMENSPEWINLNKSEFIKKDLFIKKTFSLNELDANNALIQKKKKWL